MIKQVSFGPISWLMVSEIFPLKTRGRGISLAVLVNFGSNALVTFAFSPLKVGHVSVFAAFYILCFTVIYIFLSILCSFGLLQQEYNVIYFTICSVMLRAISFLFSGKKGCPRTSLSIFWSERVLKH